MAAIQKPDGSVRPLHDATHSVMVNHFIGYQDKIECPGPAEIAAIVRETMKNGEWRSSLLRKCRHTGSTPFGQSGGLIGVTCAVVRTHRQIQFG